MYRILALNGGGIRGYITTEVLSHIERESGKRISDMFDLVVGTSVGALIGCMLDTLPAAHLPSLFRNRVKDRIFSPNCLGLKGLIGSKYNTRIKQEVFKEIIGCKNSTTNFDFAALSYDLISSRPIIFSTHENEDDNRYLITSKYDLYNSCLASSAAPVYWDPHKLDNMLLIDGAMVANDPTNIAIKLALDKGRCLDDLYIVNITTGYNNRPYNYVRSGIALKWLTPLITILMSGQPNSVSMMYKNEDVNYINLDVELQHGSDNIDDVSNRNVSNLHRDAMNLIDNNKISIEKIIQDLC